MTQDAIADRHLHALLGSAGKSIAGMPGAKRVVARMRMAGSAHDFAYMLQNVDLGLEDAACQVIWRAAADETRWQETHAVLLRSAEQHLIDRFSASS